MKKILSVVIIFLSLTTVVSAAATVPNTSVWFTPSTAKVGETIALNALVYNNQSVDATVVVAFSNVSSATALIPAQTAKTVSVSWKLPAKNTSVTATVTSAVDKNKKSIPSLVGLIGTIDVGPSVDIIVPTSNLSFPGSTVISKWITPLLSNIEAYRSKQAIYFSAERDHAKAAVDAVIVAAPVATVQNGLSSKVLGSPMIYISYAVDSSLATLFNSVALFYIVCILIVLFVLRFIVNLIF